jgi:hypothetical protein
MLMLTNSYFYASAIHEKGPKRLINSSLEPFGLMSSTSFGELYIFRDYSGKCEKNEFWKAPEDSRTQPKWASIKYASRRDKRPTCEGGAQLGPSPADRSGPLAPLRPYFGKVPPSPLRVNLNHFSRSG